MADRVSITVALLGFVEDQETIMQSAFANADKWPTPWLLTESIENARVIIVNLASEENYEEIEKLKQDSPKAEIVVFSSKKLPQTKWHLVRQANGKASIVAFSQLVLKISRSLNNPLTEKPQPPVGTSATVTESDIIKSAGHDSSSDEEEFDLESNDLLSFINQLDSLLDTKPNEKRKRFNES